MIIDIFNVVIKPKIFTNSNWVLNKMGKLLVLSIYTEQVANEISLTGNYDKSIIQDVLNEIIILLKSEKKMQSTDEFRKILSILSMGGIVHS